MVATKTITALWALERNVALREFYERITPKVVETVCAAHTGAIARYVMRIPSGSMAAASLYNLSLRTPTGRVKKEVIDQGVFEPDKMNLPSQENLERMRQMVRDWVELEKETDERDTKEGGAAMSVDEIAERVNYILGISTASGSRQRSADMEMAAQGLTKAIQAWLDGADQTPGGHEVKTPSINYGGPADPKGKEFAPTPVPASLDPAVAQQWLEAVGKAWRDYLLQSLPSSIGLELAKLFRSTKDTML
jgi:hypothetical protein